MTERALSTTSWKVSGEPLESSDERQIAGLIGRLLMHFWTENISASMREALARDWLDDLREFGPEIVSIACGDWRRGQTKRPMIADIVGLCSAEQSRRREHDQNLSLPAPNREAYAERNRKRGENLAREGRDICNQWARDRGFADFAAAEVAGKTHADVVKSIPLRNEMPRSPRHTANQYGVTATEWRPSEEQMAEGRRALGFTDTETA